MKLPSRNTITMSFGSTEPPYSAADPHKGTDFSYLPDDTIYAPVAGVVTQVPNNGRDGNGTYMRSGDLLIGLLHASKYLVPNGTTVKAGDPVAVMGDTGFAQGKHLHLAVKRNGAFIDPMSIIEVEEDMPTIKELEKLAEDRLTDIKTVAAAVSVNYRDGNDLPQVIANIKTMAGRIDELTAMVSNSDGKPVADLVADIAEVLKKYQ